MSQSRDARCTEVAIAGAGQVTPLGLDVGSTWAGLIEGRSGVRPITEFDASGLGVRIAGQVGTHEAYPSRFLGRRTRSPREAFLFRALDEALAAAGLEDGLGDAPFGVFSGCEREGTNRFTIFAEYEAPGADLADVVQRHRQDLYDRQPDAVCRTILARAGEARLFFNYTMACAAGAVAIHEALRWLRRGVIDRALVVAVDTPVHVGAVHGFEQLGALSTRNEEPELACRPFDLARDGFVLAEGAGALILERPELTASRGRRALGRLLGGGMTNNQYHLTKTPPTGEQAARAMRAALRDAGLAPEDIGYINAHGTSTDVGDAGEAAAIVSVFGKAVPTSSTKSMTGHLVAASGVVELIVALTAVREGILPPTINLEAQDPECPLDCIPNRARRSPIQFALSNNFGFGGTNVSLIVGGARL